MRDEILVLPDKIIQKIEVVFKERKPGIPCSNSELAIDLEDYVIEQKILIGEALGERFKGGKKLSARTIGRAMNRDDNIKEYGAGMSLRNLLCFYAFKKNWTATLLDEIKLSEEIVRQEGKNLKNNSQGSKVKTKSKKRLILISSLSILLIFGLIYFYYYRLVKIEKSYSFAAFDTSNESYNVLIFPFQPLEKCQFKKTDIEHTIITRLEEMNDNDGLNLHIVFDTIHCVRSFAEATTMGRQLNAHLVIWGDLYEHCSIDNEACLKFVNLSSENNVPLNKLKGESGIEKLNSMAEIKEGKLQKNIDYIIYWVAASKAISKENYSMALNYLKKIEKLNIANDELFTHIGSCYYYINLFDSSRVYFEYAFKINPSNGLLNSNYAWLLYEKFNDIKEARKHFEIALKNDSNLPQLHYNYFIFLEDKSINDSIGAKKQLEIALRIDPNHFFAENNYARLLDKTFNDAEGAKRHYLHILQNHPDFFYANLGYADLLQQKFHDYIEANKYYEIALRINPGNALAHANYAILLATRFNNKSSAKEHYMKALQLDTSFKNKDLDRILGIK